MLPSSLLPRYSLIHQFIVKLGLQLFTTAKGGAHFSDARSSSAFQVFIDGWSRRPVACGGFCLEIGSGSGLVTETLATLIPKSFCFSSDVNILATAKTELLLRNSSLKNVDSILCDLFTAFRPSFQFDVIVFNPPYVPTDDDELQRALTEHDISAAWAGGKDGRQVIDRFLKALNNFLCETGVAYLTVLESNKITEVTQIAEGLGLRAHQVMKRRAGIETLYILRFRKREINDS
ncbi:unnamed protein product [Agarophyton chilense]